MILGVQVPAWIPRGLLSLLLFPLACGDGSAAYTARYDVVVESAASRQLSKGLIWLFLPAEGHANVAPVDAPQSRLLVDNLGNRQLSISLDAVPVGFELPLSVQVSWPAETLESDLSSVPRASKFIAAEPLIEIEQPQLRDRAAAMRGGDLSETLVNIRAAVSAIRPRNEAEVATAPPRAAPAESAPEVPSGALNTIESGVGDTVDRVLLAVALLRATGLPARPVAGIVDDGDGVLAVSERQLWAEYFSDGSWHALHLAELSAGERAIAFHIFARAENLTRGSIVNNFYRGAGLRIGAVE
jgi:hypothetical protein